MEPLKYKFCKALRFLYRKFRPVKHIYLTCERNPDVASSIIVDLLAGNKPCMIARYGSTESMAFLNYLGIKTCKYRKIDFVIKDAPAWWWDERVRNNMMLNAGFFPPTDANLEKFGNLMHDDSKIVDCLACWNPYEYHFLDYFGDAKLIHLLTLDPFWSEIPWTSVLKGKRILVVHPFKETIIKQYNKRDTLFYNQEVLPEFKSLRVIKAVQSIGGNCNDFKNWFEALNWMKKEIDKEEFDICLIGCGAYGFPLAAHVKRIGKKAVHMGGSLQLLFGIIGKRWESESYGVEDGHNKSYSSLINDKWVRPDISERPKVYYQIENGCYW